MKPGGSAGIRDLGLSESALNRAFASYDGIDLYPSIIDKISAITHSLVGNYAFIDGNKRIGMSVMILLLKINNVNVHCTQKELIDLGLKTA
jgi:death-on-curing protein